MCGGSAVPARDGDRVRRQVAGRRDRSLDQASGLRVDRVDVRVRASAVRDGGDQTPVIDPGRPVAAVDHPAVEVRVRPVADRAIELRVQGMRLARAVRRTHEDVGHDVVEWLWFEDADRRDPATVG